MKKYLKEDGPVAPPVAAPRPGRRNRQQTLGELLIVGRLGKAVVMNQVAGRSWAQARFVRERHP
ncbi:hypothetical protein ACFQYP_48970 [Nonomuraea antimicrobica]